MAETKAGFRTSEFWIALVISVVTLLGSSGLVVAGSSTERIVGYIVAGLIAMGYTGTRASVKKKTVELVKNGVSEKPADPVA